MLVNGFVLDSIETTGTLRRSKTAEQLSSKRPSGDRHSISSVIEGIRHSSGTFHGNHLDQR